MASDAGIDPSMVMRYYGSKDGLFAAAVDVDLRLPDVAGLARDAVAGVLAEHFVSIWRADREGPLSILLRSAVTREDAAERLRAMFADQVVVMVRRLVGESAEADVRAALLSSYVLGLALTRHILRFPPVVAMDDRDLVTVATEHLDRILNGPLPVGAVTGGRARRTRRA